ncbi:MAG: HD domain-containing protein [Anaerolineae bacterium]|jgi:metal-dependent HD superfamily phosphatase/phosphodiesterase
MGESQDLQLVVPSRHNPKLRELVSLVNGDVELVQLWKCANVNAMDRAGFSDHGPVHVHIIANAALRLLRLLLGAGVAPGVVANYNLTEQEAEVVVVLGCCLHDLGIAISRDDHERHSLILAYPKARQLLSGIYAEPTLTILVSEVLHAVVSHHWDAHPLTLEAGVVKVADALDMSEGRSRIPFEAGEVNIHSMSAQAIESVQIVPGTDRPVRLDILMSNAAGIFQVDELLKRKLENSPLAPYVEVVARIRSGDGADSVEVYRH